MEGHDDIPIIYFTDGSALALIQADNLRDWTYFPGNPDKCLARSNNNLWIGMSKCIFNFNYTPTIKTGNFRFIGNSFEPYKYGWDGTKDGLYNGITLNSVFVGGCNKNNVGFCTALIQYNGWKIPDDYPFRVSY